MTLVLRVTQTMHPTMSSIIFHMKEYHGKCFRQETTKMYHMLIDYATARTLFSLIFSDLLDISSQQRFVIDNIRE